MAGLTVSHLPFACLQDVAAFSGCPPAVYCLLLTCRGMRGTAESAPLDFTMIMQVALSMSMKGFMNSRNIPLEVVTFNTLRNQYDHVTAILSGPAVLQIVLGEDWGHPPDVDIFCTQSGLPEVVKHLGHVGCQDVTADGWPLNRLGLWSPTHLHLHDPKIDMVFRYAFFHTLRDSQSLQATYFNLVTAHDDVLDARALLRNFDLSCCAVSIDTACSRFHIPDPHLTFRKRSRTNTKHLSLMTGFASGVVAYARVGYGTGILMDDPCWRTEVKAAFDRCAQDEESIRELMRTRAEARITSTDALQVVYNLCITLLARQKQYVDCGICLQTPVPMLKHVVTMMKIPQQVIDRLH